ncbi:MAG: DUF2065 domain-containing protein [Sphingobium sp.]|nr:DUF2065 domain-containing protein [Sphingobium sp.]
MSVFMLLTLHLAVALGVYIVVASLAMLLAPADRIDRLYEEMRDSPGLMLAFGVFAFAIGAVWLMVHREWITPLGIVISVVGWIFAVEGVLMLVAPAVMVRLFAVFRPILRPACMVAIVIGALLVLAGLTGRADAPGYALAHCGFPNCP